MKIVLLPKWLKDTLEFNRQDLKVLTSLPGLLAILSQDDVAFYQWVNQDAKRLVSREVWLNTGTPASVLTTPEIEGWEQKLSLIPARGTPSPRECWFGPLCEETTRWGLLSELLDEESIVIYPYVLPEDVTDQQAQRRFYERLCGQYVTLHSFEELAGCGIFKEYLATLPTN